MGAAGVAGAAVAEAFVGGGAGLGFALLVGFGFGDGALQLADAILEGGDHRSRGLAGRELFEVVLQPGQLVFHARYVRLGPSDVVGSFLVFAHGISPVRSRCIQPALKSNFVKPPITHCRQ